jgi:alanine racemase
MRDSVDARDLSLYSAWLDVDLDALAHNYAYVMEQIAPARMIAVVKAYGLGTGTLMAARKLESLGVHMLAVSNFLEGVYLRQHGVKSPLLVMNGLLPAQMAAAIGLDISFFCFDPESLRTADRLARELGRRARVHLKVDTGLGRLGFLPHDTEAVREALAGLGSVDIEGIASHQATPIEAEHDPFTREQYAQFLAVADALDPGHRWMRHFSSSNAVPRLPDMNADAVRCQSILWGWVHYLPVPWPLRPVASYRARLVQVKDLPAGHNVGYNFRYTTKAPTKLGVLPLGVVDGLKGDHIHGGYVLVRGKRCPIIGVCSCVSMVDVTPAAGAAAGDEVVLFGSQGEETLSAIEFGWLGKSSFMSVMALVSPRIPRVYREGGRVVQHEVFCAPATREG